MIAGEQRLADPFERGFLSLRPERLAGDDCVRKLDLRERRPALDHDAPLLAADLDNLARRVAGGGIDGFLPNADLRLLRRERERMRERALHLLRRPNGLEPADRLRVFDE